MSRVYDWALKNYQRLLESSKQDLNRDKKIDSSKISLNTEEEEEDYDTL